MKVWIRIKSFNETFNTYPGVKTEKMITDNIKLDLERDGEIVGQINIFPFRKKSQKSKSR